MLGSCAALFLQLLAQAPTDAGDPMPVEPGPGPQQSMLPTLLMFGAIFFLMYLFVFRPQSKKEAEEKSMLERIKKDDHVVTKSGIFGVVVNVKDDEVTLRIDENQNTKVRFQKSAIAAILGEDDKSKSEKKS